MNLMDESFETLEAHGSERDVWLSLLRSSSSREVFAHPDYLRLFIRRGDRPVCAVYRCVPGTVMYPLILRDLRRTSFGKISGRESYDAVGPPFGYGGPFVDARGDHTDIVCRFYEAYKQWALSEGSCASMLRFPPRTAYMSFTRAKSFPRCRSSCADWMRRLMSCSVITRTRFNGTSEAQCVQGLGSR